VFLQTQRFRAKVKILLERLVRRYGYEEIATLVPPQHQPLLHAVKKALKEKKKKAKPKPLANGQHQEVEEELKAPKASQSWIIQDAEDEPIDFTDPSHIQLVTCT